MAKRGVFFDSPIKEKRFHKIRLKKLKNPRRVLKLRKLRRPRVR